MNQKTKEQCHKILDALLDEVMASGRNEDLFDISIKTVDVNENLVETRVTEFQAEVVVDTDENAHIEDSSRATSIYNALSGALQRKSTVSLNLEKEM